MHRDEASLGAFLCLLTASARPAAIAKAMATGPLRSSAIDLVTVHALTDGALELRCQFGLLAEQRRLSAKLPLGSPTAHVAALESGVATFIDGAHLLIDHPFMRRLQLPEIGEFLFTPLQMAAESVGVLALHTPSRFDRSWDLHARILPMASAVTLWLMASGRDEDTPSPDARLRITARQQRVLAAVREGASNAAIASDLGFSVGTIKADITAMSALFGASGRLDLARKAARAGF